MEKNKGKDLRCILRFQKLKIFYVRMFFLQITYLVECLQCFVGNFLIAVEILQNAVFL